MQDFSFYNILRIYHSTMFHLSDIKCHLNFRTERAVFIFSVFEGTDKNREQFESVPSSTNSQGCLFSQYELCNFE